MTVFNKSTTGYAVATLVGPTKGVFTKSPTGYQVGILIGPVAGLSASLTGYAVATLTAPPPPAPPYTASKTGFAVNTLAPHQKPVLVLMPDNTLQAVPILTWDGVSLS